LNWLARQRALQIKSMAKMGKKEIGLGMWKDFEALPKDFALLHSLLIRKR